MDEKENNQKRVGIKEMCEASQVYVWANTKTVRKQSIAESSYLVAMITMELNHRLLGNDDLTGYLLRWAMMYNVVEIVKVNISTTGYMPEMMPKEYIDISKIVFEKHLIVDDIVKLAIQIESVVFLTLNSGDRHDVVMTRMAAELRMAKHCETCDSKYEYESLGKDWEGIARDLTAELLCGKEESGNG